MRQYKTNELIFNITIIVLVVISMVTSVIKCQYSENDDNYVEDSEIYVNKNNNIQLSSISADILYVLNDNYSEDLDSFFESYFSSDCVDKARDIINTLYDDNVNKDYYIYYMDSSVDEPYIGIVNIQNSNKNVCLILKINSDTHKVYDIDKFDIIDNR